MAGRKTYSLISWNVNGIRAASRKGFLDWLRTERPDIAALQETKAHVEQLSESLIHPDGYESYWNSSDRKKGYSGTVTYTRVSPLLATMHFGEPLLDEEGRVVMLEYEPFYLFNVYFPNGGSGEHRLKYKLDFYERFLRLIEAFRKKKPVILCGDVNTAHTEIDLARPKENEKTSGFMPVERAWIDALVKRGYLDTFRLFHEGPEHYSWWDMKTRSRERNVGWRIDYFFVSDELKRNIRDAFILSDVHGSDHCPVGLKLEF
ncbi:exodeoxyribonuclease III [Patescibacteria group bacterium]|nr:exodeoxyribonuclease III [Patescibacteria group bacterium]MDL1953124.1 exodeoxyribonuclease III [Candidatus Uhrbacteria bacterium UHB]RIL00420.1 MAG: exodeoxyribonuclease III [Candidatus Uhrbacteria bacterium]